MTEHIDLVVASDVHSERTHDWDRYRSELDTLIRVADLTSEESYVLARLYDKIPRTLEQIGREMGVSHTTVGNYRDNAIAKLENILGRKIVLKG